MRTNRKIETMLDGEAKVTCVDVGIVTEGHGCEEEGRGITTWWCFLRFTIIANVTIPNRLFGCTYWEKMLRRRAKVEDDAS